MAYPHKWSPISYKSSAGQRKDTGQRPMLYRLEAVVGVLCAINFAAKSVNSARWKLETADTEGGSGK